MWKIFNIKRKHTIHWISFDIAQTIIQEEHPLIVDTRNIDDYRQCHVPDAIHLDKYSFCDFIKNANKKRSLLMYCYSGKGSKVMARRLSNKGFKKVYCLEGGLKQWEGSNCN